MRFELDEYNRNVPDADLVADLRRVAENLNKAAVTIDEYNEYGKYHNTTLTRRFGSWFKCLEIAGLERTRNLNLSNEELFENLAEIWIALGRQPRYVEIQKPFSKFSAGTYEKRFGGWRSALEAFVEYVNATEQDEPVCQRVDEVSITTKRSSRGVNLRLRFVILRRDNFKCRLCGRSPANIPGLELHVDHIQPWSKGGETVEQNLQTLCSDCNLGKSDLLLEKPSAE